MKTKQLIIICSLSFLTGIFFCAYYFEWIIFRSPFTKQNTLLAHKRTHKKTIELLLWTPLHIKKEQQELLWSNDTTQNIQYLINAWLTNAYEEKIITKKTELESALLNPTGKTVYLSFDHNFLPKNELLYTKAMIIESLLQTMATNNIPIKDIYFLVHHKEMQDYHLDFSRAWPIEGFINL